MKTHSIPNFYYKLPRAEQQACRQAFCEHFNIAHEKQFYAIIAKKKIDNDRLFWFANFFEVSMEALMNIERPKKVAGTSKRTAEAYNLS
jgi:hypothetical protein